MTAIKSLNEMELDFLGDVYHVRATFRLLHEIENKTGMGFVTLTNKLYTSEYTMIDIKNILLCITPDKSEDEIEELIYEMGVVPIASQLIDLATVALYGGKAFEEESKKKLVESQEQNT